MNSNLFSTRRQKGQTIIVALMVLFVLLILGTAFVGILNRTLKGASNAKNRGVNNDFAEAGIRYAHGQLVNSELGADWWGLPSSIPEVAPDITRDPDAFMMRPPATAGGAPLLFPGTTRADQGGPDGLGPFFRIDYRGGRALVRVRYAPGDPSIFQSTGVGYLKDPGLARNFLQIDSVGRRGEIRPNDPTLASRASVQYRNYANQAAFNAEFGKLREFDGKEVSSRKLIAFAQIGLIDYARFVTNKYKSTRAAEFGMPANLGVLYRENPAANGDVIIHPTVMGSTQTAYNLTPNGAGAAVPNLPFGGSMHVNGSIHFLGSVQAYLNQTLGDRISAAGEMSSEPGSSFLVTKTQWDRTSNSWQTTAPTPIPFDSYSGSFTTFGGVIRDSSQNTDGNGEARSVGIITPPTMQPISDNSENANTDRYRKSTKESGVQGAAGNTGQFGHGNGPYVDNASDYQVPDEEQSRRDAGSTASMVQDWLSPFADGGNGTFRSGWHGPYYIPIGAYLQLETTGFTIMRNAHPDQRPEERTWRTAAGANSGLTAIRYRIGVGTDGQVRIVNTLTPGLSASINNALTPADFQLGPVFNGVVYFEGNVRVRGIIPTDVQMTVVSNKTIYIEGNINKGMRANDVTSAYPGAVTNGQLNRPSRSTLMLMSKDYVTLNPTMFVGPASEQDAQVEQGGQGTGGYSPLKLQAPNGSVNLLVDFALTNIDPANANNTLLPQNWVPAPMSYFEYDPTNPANPNGTGNKVDTRLMLTQALDFTQAGPPNTFYSVNVNKGAAITTTMEMSFETATSLTNTARYIWAQINNPGPAPATGLYYGLGSEAFQQAPKFETIAHLMIGAGVTADSVNNRISDINQYYVQGTNSLEVFLTQFGTEPTGNLQIARSIVVPMDVKIEASIYAEEGSFFVIPGDWFNMNPNDRRDRFEARVTQLGTLGNPDPRGSAELERLEDFGSAPGSPFYGEPLDVKIDIVGSIAENMPAPIAQQSEWLKKWGWIPIKRPGVHTGANTQQYVPHSHISNWTKATAGVNYTGNLNLSYDPVLATGRINGFGFDTPDLGANPLNPNAMIRTRVINGVTHQLPPMPRLPVSPTLAFFGEVK